MDFAKKQLEKYGWKEGQGIGKHGSGIMKAIKPKLKFDKRGIGHSLSDDLINPWWHRVYDEAAKNVATDDKKKWKSEETEKTAGKDVGSMEQVRVTKKKRGVHVLAEEKLFEGCNDLKTSRDEDSLDFNTDSDEEEIEEAAEDQRKTKTKNNVYKDFVRTSTLTVTGEKRLVEACDSSDEEVIVRKKKITSGICDLTEEELFKACGGRTAHKGARHGHNMNAKLNRIEEQERLLLEKLQASLNNEDVKKDFITGAESVLKKEKKSKHKY